MKKLVRRLAVLLVVFALPLSAAATVLAPGASIAASGDVSGEYKTGLTNPGIWDGGPGAIVTYSFASLEYETNEGAADDGGSNSGYIMPIDSFMPDGAKHQIELAFSTWASYANITFNEVPDGGGSFGDSADGAAGDIRIGGHWFDGSGSTLAHGYYPPENGGTKAGDIHFDIDENWVIGFAGKGYDIFTVALHEIGHAIGLGHSGDNQARMRPGYTETFSGLGTDDIAGVVALYGEKQEADPIPVTEPPAPWLYLLGVAGVLFAVSRRTLRS